MKFLHILAAALAFCVPARAADLLLDSGSNRVRLLELFTSEGCSSCPPAEAWLAKLVDHDGLWEDFVPVELHVNYWDNLGWEDPLASVDATLRQREYAATWSSGSVYTPCFVLDGQPFRQVVVPPASAEQAGVLRAIMKNPTAGTARKIGVSFTREGRWIAHVAPLGFGIASNVNAGENRGKKLRHEFVALTLASGEIDRESGRVVLSLPPTAAAEMAVAVWVTPKGSPAPAQAVGGWLPGRRP